MFMFHLKNLARKGFTRACWAMLHPLASLDQYTRVTLNTFSWNSELKRPNDFEGQGQ